jgi:transposase
MLGDISKCENIYIACGYTDMRKGIDGLAATVQEVFGLDPLSNSIFLFCGRSPNKMKALYWERDGFVLMYKRLEDGRFQWPRNEMEVKLINREQFKWLMSGLKMDQRKTIRKPEKIVII